MKIMTDAEIADMLRESVTQLYQEAMWSEWLQPEDGCYAIEEDNRYENIETFFPEEYFRLTGECPTCGGTRRHYPIEYGYTYGGVPLTQECPVGASMDYWDKADEQYELWKDVRSAGYPF